ncbi:MAG TPA: hypothetical protein VG826_35480 [Pirellulales bacterium]|nr:hypothetical protein [Pirellulales bacterium]
MAASSGQYMGARMATFLTEAEIKAILDDPKPVTKRYRSVMAPRPRKDRPNQLGRRLNVRSVGGKTFKVYTSVNARLTNNFSIGLIWYPSAHEKLTLIRCNGWHEAHPNRIERTIIQPDTCHIHRITERYQLVGKPEAYAEETTEYHDFKTALQYFFSKFGFFLRDDDYGHELPLIDKQVP